jgi:CHAT domain-containing protein
LDESFTYESLAGALRRGNPVVHVASHFVFDSVKPDNSFLLLGDGQKLSLKTFKSDPRLSFKEVDQLTLSACDTASGIKKGDGQEVESFGSLAQARGAQSVMATLWSVYDESTGLLMKEFYRLRYQEKENKAEALKNAQLALMQGSLGGDVEKSGQSRGILHVLIDTEQDVAKAASWEGKDFSHPYYWAPFVLMGNWR